MATGRSAVPAVITATVPGAARRPEDHRGERAAPGDGARAVAERRADGGDRLDLRFGRPGQEDRPVAAGEELLDDRGAVLGRLARSVHGLGHALAQVPVVVDPGETEIGVGQPAQLAHRVVGRAPAVGDRVDERAEGRTRP